MTEKQKYRLSIGVEDGADVDEIEEFLQEILLDLYDQGEVESIKVIRDGNTTDAADVEELLSIIADVDSEYIRRAIDSVKELENIDDE